METNSTLPAWFDPLEATIGYAFMVLVVFTLPLYILEIAIMLALRKTSYKGIFYRLFTIGATVDVIALVNNYFGAIFISKGWFVDFYLSKGTSIGHVYLVIAWTARGVQGCTVTLMALNRATAVCLPIRHKRMWNSRWALGLHVFQGGIGLLIGSFLIPQNFYWKFQDKGYYIQFEDKAFRVKYFLFAYLIETLFVVMIVIINLTMWAMFKRKYRLRVTSSTLNSQYNQKVILEKQRQENNLTFVSVVTCAVEFIYYIYIVYAFGINTQVNTRVFFFFYNSLNDIYSCVSAWLILRYSKPMRTHIYAFVKFVLI